MDIKYSEQTANIRLIKICPCEPDCTFSVSESGLPFDGLESAAQSCLLEASSGSVILKARPW